MSTYTFKSKTQDAPFRGFLSFISGVSSEDDAQQDEQQKHSTSSENEIAQLQQELLMLISELEEFVLDDDIQG